MNSRERVLSALKHREPDLVPLDFGGHRSSGINAMAYARLKKALGISQGNIYVYDIAQQLAIVEKPVRELLGVDCIELGRGFLTDDSEWRDWVLPDGTPCKIPAYVNIEKRGSEVFLVSPEGIDLAVQKPGSLFFEQIFFPLKKCDFANEDFSSLPEILNRTMWTGIPTPGSHLPFTAEGLAKLAQGARALRESTDCAIIGLFGGNMFEAPQVLFGMSNYLSYLVLYPEACLRLSEVLCEIYLKNLEQYLSAVGPYIDIILFGDDLGGQNGLLISREMYLRYFYPYHKKLWHRAKEFAGLKVMLHCCGGIEPLLNDLIDAGIDAINPVQISSKGMEPKLLKEKYGDRLCFWGGGCDTHKILPGASPKEIEEHIRNQIQIFAPGGGFIFQQVHNILPEVPVQNIIAMFEAFNKYRQGV